MLTRDDSELENLVRAQILTPNLSLHQVVNIKAISGRVVSWSKEASRCETIHATPTPIPTPTPTPTRTHTTAGTKMGDGGETFQCKQIFKSCLALPWCIGARSSEELLSKRNFLLLLFLIRSFLLFSASKQVLMEKPDERNAPWYEMS